MYIRKQGSNHTRGTFFCPRGSTPICGQYLRFEASFLLASSLHDCGCVFDVTHDCTCSHVCTRILNFRAFRFNEVESLCGTRVGNFYVSETKFERFSTAASRHRQSSGSLAMASRPSSAMSINPDMEHPCMTPLVALDGLPK